MTGWDFAKYVIDNAYDHWCITLVFLCCIFRVTLFNFSSSEREDGD